MIQHRRLAWGGLGCAIASLLGSLAACGGSDPAEKPAACQGASCAEPDGGVANEGGIESGSTAPEAACVASGEADEPDDDFVDANCDGIDGDAASGVFVAPSGSDSASGDREAPLKTLSKAVELAQQSGKQIYVCNGDYPENVTIEQTGVQIFGGYDCENAWVRTKERARVAPSTGTPLRIESANGTVLDRLNLEAPAGVEPSESSVALVIDASDDVKLNRISAFAKEGAQGASGKTTPAVTQPALGGANGTATDGKICNGAGTIPGSCTSVAAGGAYPTIIKCPGGLATGYRGGYGGSGGNAKLNKPAGAGGVGYFLGGIGGKPGFGGGPGNPGEVGEVGIAGGAFGSIADGVYAASNGGSDGALGMPGRAGGGGAGGNGTCQGDVCATYVVGGGGGQGGYPGCGGEGGKGGGGGGASIGVLVIDSKVEIFWSSVHTNGGGAGGTPGDGALGQPGGPGGNGGSAASSNAGHPGGNGGIGGKGGSGGPGGGGPSIGILVQGTAPITEAVTFDIASGGQGASGIAGADAENGLSKDMHSIGESPSDAGTD